MSEKRDRRGCPPGAGTVEAQPLPGLPLGRIGNPPHEITEEKREKVRLLAKVASQAAVAEAMGFSEDTLRRYYLPDYQAGEREAVNAVKSKLLGAALGGSVNAAWKYLQLKGEVKRAPVEVTGPNGGPIPVVDLSRLTEDQLEEYGRLAAIAEGLPPDSILVESIEPGDSAQP